MIASTLATLILCSPPPPPPTTATCVGVEQCRVAAEHEKAEKERRAKHKAAKAKLDSCKGLEACKRAEAEARTLELEPEPDFTSNEPTEQDLAKARQDLENAREREATKAHNLRQSRARQQRDGTLVVGGGYGLIAFPDIRGLTHMHGGAWSVNVYQSWFLPKVQLSAGAGIHAIHASADVLSVDEISTVHLRVHHVTVPVQFRLGGPSLEQLFFYGTVGTSIGFVIASDQTSAAAGFVVEPVLLGIGGYGTLGNTNLVLGAQARTDVVGAAMRTGVAIDAQVLFGFNFN